MFPICDTRDEGIRIIAMLLWIKGKNGGESCYNVQYTMFKDVTYVYIYGIRDRIVRQRYVILYLEREKG